jgi:transposase
LQATQVPVAVVQPSLIRHHAKRVLAKNDAIDATMIADYTQQYRPRVAASKDDKRCKVRAFSDRRYQLIEDRVREQNRLEACDCKPIATQLRASIKRLNQQIAKLETRIEQLIKADEQMAGQHE